MATKRVIDAMQPPLRSLSTRRPSARLLLVVLVVAVLAVTLPHAAHPWPAQQGFAPALGVATIVGYLLSGYLLFARYRADGHARTLPLAATYLFAGLLVVPQLLTQPGIFSAGGYLGARTGTATWFWAAWHAAIPIGLLATFLPRREHMPVFARRSRAIAAVALGVALLTLALAIVLLRAGAGLPGLTSAAGFAALRRTVGPELLALSGLALALVAWRTRSTEDSIEGWMLLVAVEAFADVLLTLWAGHANTAGWYVAQINGLCAAYVVLLALTIEIGRLYGQMARANAALARVAYRDGLTGLYNRRALDERLAQEVARAGRYGGGFALLMLDIDHFKAINDTHGHGAGDRVLQDVARIVVDCTRRSDWTARFGGEEFVVVLPETDDDGAALLAERIRATIAQEPLAVSDAVTVAVTASVGVAAFPDAGRSAEALLASVDRALYRAKEGGRDRVCRAPVRANPAHAISAA